MTILTVGSDTPMLEHLNTKLSQVYPEATIVIRTDPLLAAQYSYQNPVDKLITQLNMKRMDGQMLERFVQRENPEVVTHFIGTQQELETAFAFDDETLNRAVVSPITDSSLSKALGQDVQTSGPEAGEKLFFAQRTKPEQSNLREFTNRNMCSLIFDSSGMPHCVDYLEDPAVSQFYLQRGAPGELVRFHVSREAGKTPMVMKDVESGKHPVKVRCYSNRVTLAVVERMYQLVKGTDDLHPETEPYGPVKEALKGLREELVGRCVNPESAEGNLTEKIRYAYEAANESVNREKLGANAQPAVQTQILQGVLQGLENLLQCGVGDEHLPEHSVPSPASAYLPVSRDGRTQSAVPRGQVPGL